MKLEPCWDYWKKLESVPRVVGPTLHPPSDVDVQSSEGSGKGEMQHSSLQDLT